MWWAPREDGLPDRPQGVPRKGLATHEVAEQGPMPNPLGPGCRGGFCFGRFGGSGGLVQLPAKDVVQVQPGAQAGTQHEGAHELALQEQHVGRWRLPVAAL